MRVEGSREPSSWSHCGPDFRRALTCLDAPQDALQGRIPNVILFEFGDLAREKLPAEPHRPPLILPSWRKGVSGPPLSRSVQKNRRIDAILGHARELGRGADAQNRAAVELAIVEENSLPRPLSGQ